MKINVVHDAFGNTLYSVSGNVYAPNNIKAVNGYRAINHIIAQSRKVAINNWFKQAQKVLASKYL